MMVQILKRIAIGVGLATRLVIAIGFMLPSTYTITRSVVIEAEVAPVHALVSDLERWPDWTPWQNEDPTIVVSLGPITSGVGASQTWVGDSGVGELTFTRCDPDWGIAYDMGFDEGKFVAECDMTYHLADGGTEVIWRMTGDNGLNVLERYMGLVMDAMVGPMFEDGLNKLKLVADTSVIEGP